MKIMAGFMRICIIAILSKGLVGLPISPAVRKISFVADLDKKIKSDYTSNIDDWEQALLDHSEGQSQEKPWAIVVRRLANLLRNSDETNSDVLTLMEAGICDQNQDI